MSGGTSTAAIISAAVDGFNHGQQDALSACTGPGAVHPQTLLGCAASRTCRARRPIPLVAGQDKLSLTKIREVGEDRAVCNLDTDSGIKLVGLYAVRDDRISAACHYISDTDMLTDLGVLPLTELPDETQADRAPTFVAGKADRPPTSLSLGESLLDARLSHRQHRLRLAIHALDQRVEALSTGGHPIPQALTTAIREFQQELDDTQRRQPEPPPTPLREHQPATTAEPDGHNCWSALGVDDVYPGTTLVGSCTRCRRLLFAHEPHEWQDMDTRELCLPLDEGAALYCGPCSAV